MLAGHAHGFDGDARATAAEPGERLGCVSEGQVVLRTDAGEQLLAAGMCAGFPAGVQDGHQLINRSAADAVYLEISNRDGADGAHYTDPDVDLLFSPPHAPGRFTRRDGTPV